QADNEHDQCDDRGGDEDGRTNSQAGPRLGPQGVDAPGAEPRQQQEQQDTKHEDPDQPAQPAKESIGHAPGAAVGWGIAGGGPGHAGPVGNYYRVITGVVEVPTDLGAVEAQAVDTATHIATDPTTQGQVAGGHGDPASDRRRHGGHSARDHEVAPDGPACSDVDGPAGHDDVLPDGCVDGEVAARRPDAAAHLP